MREFVYGWYATRMYLPFSGAARRWRRWRRGTGHDRRPCALPTVSWTHLTDRRIVTLWEPKKADGNVRISELGILNAIASRCAGGTNLFEIGTFDGRTSRNLALASPPDCAVYTLDLPPDVSPRFTLLSGEQHLVNTTPAGHDTRYTPRERHTLLRTIHHLHGDSATFDFSPWHRSCSLVFVDGSHAYDYVMADTVSATRLLVQGGIIVWHDYGVWEDVTRALDELDANKTFRLRNIRGTSLVYWKDE